MGTNRAYDIVISQEILQEISSVLNRTKFKLTPEEVEHVIDALTTSSEIIPITSTFKVVKEDSDDNIIINTAHDGNAGYIVSGDDHLLDLKRFRSVKIVSVNEMLRILRDT